MEVLTVKLVEEIQEAVLMGKVIESFVSRLRQATVPALLEYGCLRWGAGNRIPPLPAAIRSSQSGDALMQVRCDLGFRTTGPQKQALKRLDTHAIEFHVIEGNGGLQDDEWTEFEIRFDRSAQSVGFSSKKAHALHAALHEMAENAVSSVDNPACCWRSAQGWSHGRCPRWTTTWEWP
jgi:hypothetical protein